MIHKPLPYDEKLEASVLSGLINNVHDINIVHDYLETLSDDLFNNPIHKKTFSELKKMVMEDKTIGLPSILNSLSEQAFAQFSEFPHMEFMLEKSIDDLKKVLLRREIITKSRDLEILAYDDQSERDDLIENFNLSANEISGLKPAEKPSTLKVLKAAVNRVVEAFKGKSGERVMYCHNLIDAAVSVFRKQVHALGADQGGGKTAFALDCFRRQIKAGLNVVYFCTESGSDELLLRMIGSELKIDMQSLLTGEGMNKGLMDRFGNIVENFQKQYENFWIIGLGDWDRTFSSANSILSQITRDSGKIDMVYWDFLQDMLPPRSSKNIDIIETIRLNTAGIKLATERHNVASTILSQFRKERAGKKPTKQDFWGASAIINASHVMSCLHPEYEKKENQEPPEIVPIWWYSVKTRLIKQWSRKLMFDGAHGIFHAQARFDSADRPPNNTGDRYYNQKSMA